MSTALCGYIAATTAAVFHGSFVVPMRGKAANSVDIDPLVFQTYKTVTCFVFSWLVLALGEKLVFTPWAIISALLWVPGGTAGVFAVRTIGVAASVGTWAGTAVLVSGLCGFMLFHEGLKSKFLGYIALLMMIVGLIGMSYTSAPSSPTTDTDGQSTVSSNADDDDNKKDGLEYKLLDDVTIETENTSIVEEDIEHHDEECLNLVADGAVINPDSNLDNDILLCGVKVPVKLLGFCAAIFNGCTSGCVYVPMHYSEAKGLGYLISFATGALMVLICAWSLRFAFNINRTRSISKAYTALPSLHLSVMWKWGGLSGTMWMIGTIGSMVSVDSLGLGVGMSITQSSLIISGLWGMIHFREVKGLGKICCWFVAAACNLSGVLLLAMQHDE